MLFLKLYFEKGPFPTIKSQETGNNKIFPPIIYNATPQETVVPRKNFGLGLTDFPAVFSFSFVMEHK